LYAPARYKDITPVPRLGARGDIEFRQIRGGVVWQASGTGCGELSSDPWDCCYW